MLQLGELGAGERNPPLRRAEVHKHGVVFHAEYDAESVLVVGHLIVDGERLGRGRRSRGAERAVGQVALGCSAGCLHSYHHAPFRADTGYSRTDCFLGSGAARQATSATTRNGPAGAGPFRWGLGGSGVVAEGRPGLGPGGLQAGGDEYRYALLVVADAHAVPERGDPADVRELVAQERRVHVDRDGGGVRGGRWAPEPEVVRAAVGLRQAGRGAVALDRARLAVVP